MTWVTSAVHVFDSAVRQSPDDLALTGVDGDWTYLQLARAASAVGACLSSTKPGTRVAFIGRRTAAFPASVLATFRNGDVLVPLEEEWSIETLREIVNTARVTTILASGPAALSIGQRLGLQVVDLDDCLSCTHVAELSAPDTEEPDEVTASRSGSYIMFTSGSTGAPKGVLTPENRLGAHAIRLAARLNLTSSDRVLQFTSASIDIALEELFVAWAVGAPVVTLPSTIRLNLRAFVAYLEQYSVSVVDLPTSFWRTWLDAMASGDVPLPSPTLRIVGVGSEPVAGSDIERWIALDEDIAAVYNMYGSTETSITNIVDGPICHGDLVEPNVIGVPLNEVTWYILDSELAQVPNGQKGQLYIRDDVAALGYDNDGRKTAEAFVPDPFGLPGSRMYATGDEVSCRSDGRLVFHRRLDDVVMIRGFSVDPNAVESVIREVSGVATVHVGLDSTTQRLTADITPDDSDASVVEAWRNIYDSLYESDMAGRNSTFNTATWFSALDGSRLSDSTMFRWLTDIVEKIETCRPERVLELGCGTGMVLNRLAPGIRRYVGVDISSVAIHAAEATLPELKGDVDVTLREQTALEAVMTIEEQFDTVILNSVVQHFPGRAYLETVFARLSEIVSPHGCIVIGDVRNLDLDVEYREWANHRLDAPEQELLLSASYFAALTNVGDRHVRADVTSKYTDDGSEMERFRYDVVLHFDDDTEVPRDDHFVGLPADSFSVERALRLATDGAPILVSSLDRLEQPVGAIRQELLEKGFVSEAAPSSSSSTRYDLVIASYSQYQQARRLLREVLSRSAPATLTSDPGLQQRSELVASVVESVRRRLPEHLRPVDYRVLVEGGTFVPVASPRSASDLVVSKDAYDSACTEIERLVIAICQEVLDGQRIELNDDFFDLGGNSLNMARVLARIRTMFNVEISVEEFFRASQVSDLAALVQKRDAAKTGSNSYTMIPIVDTNEGPASAAQERLWLLHELYPGSTAYHAPFIFTVPGGLDTAQLAVAAAVVADAHPTLRTALVFREGELRQEITDRSPVVEEIADSDSADESHILTGAEAAFVDRAFDLSKGDVFRVGWRQLSDDTYRIIVVVHHIAIDELSLQPFFEAFAAAYRGGNAPELTVPATRYLDYAIWEQSQDRSAVQETAEKFWKEYLADAPTLLEFPDGNRRPTVAQGKGRRAELGLTGKQETNVRALCAREGLTRYQFWMAVFGLFVARESGSEDVLIGAPSGARRNSELEQIIGFFVNTLPIRLRRVANPTVSEWFRDSARSLVEALSEDRLPLQRIAEIAGVERNLAHNPLFQTMVVMEPEEELTMDLGSDVAIALDEPERSSTVDLSLIIRPRGPETRLHFVYNPDLFHDDSIRRMVRRFSALLDTLLKDPEIRVNDGALWAGLEPSVRTGPAVLDMQEDPVFLQVSKTAHHTPAAVAVVSQERSITYRELAQLVDSLKAGLVASGPVPPFVPVILESSPEMVAAMLAVNATGSAFVPIDPTWPQTRQERILLDIGATVSITKNGVTLLSEGKGSPTELTQHEAVLEIELDKPMYAIYTSGSTGLPKGAINTHRGVLNRLDWMTRNFPDGSHRVVLQSTPPHYDSCIWEYFWPLVKGGTTVLSPPALQTDPVALCATVEQYGVTAIDMVPGLYQRVLETAATDSTVKRQLTSLLLAVVGGEPLTVQVAELVHAAGLPVQVVNLYGPTEASIGSIAYFLTQASGSPIPIGSPIQNTSALILDENFEPVPVGIAGELFLGGHCVGSGYIGNAHETRRRFLDSERWGRLYRTGDEARVSFDGSLEFLGRLDQQTNYLGVRVEPAEVSRAIETLPDVAEAVVMEVETADPNDIDMKLKELLSKIMKSENATTRRAAEALIRSEINR